MEQGSSNLVQNMGHKGPVLRPRCIGPRRARTQIPFNSFNSIHVINGFLCSQSYQNGYGEPFISSICDSPEVELPHTHFYVHIINVAGVQTCEV
jgi:hypothetical protein